MALRDEITALFAEGYDVFRPDVLNDASSLKLFDDTGSLLATLTTGWLWREVDLEDTIGQRLEIRITNRDGIDFLSIEVFEFNGKRYGREGFGNPPTGNPAEWIYGARPIGAATPVTRSSEITGLFAEMYDAFRANVQGEEADLRFLDAAGNLTDTITTGWLWREVSEEQAGGRRVELRIADRGNDLAQQEFFGIAGTRYQREGQANPPIGNPAEWIMSLRPIGLDSLETFRLIDDAGRFVKDSAGNQVIWGNS